mgnify:CR=1 FL=1
MILLEQEKSVNDVLEKLNISFESYEHGAVFTVSNKLAFIRRID